MGIRPKTRMIRTCSWDSPLTRCGLGLRCCYLFVHSNIFGYKVAISRSPVVARTSVRGSSARNYPTHNNRSDYVRMYYNIQVFSCVTP